MKKVINITLGGIVFSIEEEAYKSLSVYLEAIKQNLLGNDDYNEIVEDVETAIAEKFTVRKRSEKMAVTHTDVEMVTLEMGLPSDFGEEGGGDAGGGTNSDTESNESTDGTKKRLYRDTDNAIIAGVASGLARYFDIDPVVVRLIFAVSIFFNGLGILAYIILWLVIPRAETTTQKYEMRGEKVTLNQISERVKKKINEVDAEKIKEGAQNTWGGIRPVFVKIFEVLGILIRALVSLLRYLAGFAFLVGGALSLAGLVSAYSIVLLSDKVLLPLDVQTALEVMLGSALGIVAILSSFIMMTIPLFVVILIGGSLLAKRNLFTVSKSISLAVVWIVAVVVAFSTSALQVEQVIQKIGPIEGRFDDSQFELRWGDGKLHGDDDSFWFEFGDEPLLGNDVTEFKRQLEEAVRIEIGQPIEGYQPFMFMEVFPGLEESDFDEVEALIGQYEYSDGVLTHELGNVRLVHSAAEAVSPEGIETLLENVVDRLGLEPGDFELDEVINKLRGDTVKLPTPLPPDTPVVIINEPVACTADAKICPDGTGVGRVGPNCEFAACPGESKETIVCSEEMKSTEACIEIYAPVCGLVDVQCITTPCPPVETTFSNGCAACAEGNVSSYTEGECSI